MIWLKHDGVETIIIKKGSPELDDSLWLDAMFRARNINVRILSFVIIFKSNVRETWRVILVREADIFLSESLRILAERLSQSET